MASGIQLDFEKLPANQNVTVAIGPASAVANIAVPTAAELNAMRPASQSISWSDFDFGVQASETVNDPSLADVSNYTDFGAANYGGAISFYYPKNYDDPSNPHALVYNLTEKPGTFLVVAIRIDGAKKTSAVFANGDRVHTFLVQTDSEANSLTGADAQRRTVGLLQQSVFSVYTIVGPHVLVATPTALTRTVTAGPGRLSVAVAGKLYTNALSYSSSDPSVLTIGPGGVYRPLKAGTATITIRDEDAGTSTTVTATITA